jgi:hypothetical protein
MRYVDAIKEMAAGGNKVVFMPYEASGVMGSLGSMKEMLNAMK